MSSLQSVKSAACLFYFLTVTLVCSERLSMWALSVIFLICVNGREWALRASIECAVINIFSYALVTVRKRAHINDCLWLRVEKCMYTPIQLSLLSTGYSASQDVLPAAAGRAVVDSSTSVCCVTATFSQFNALWRRVRL